MYNCKQHQELSFYATHELEDAWNIIHYYNFIVVSNSSITDGPTHRLAKIYGEVAPCVWILY